MYLSMLARLISLAFLASSTASRLACAPFSASLTAPNAARVARAEKSSEATKPMACATPVQACQYAYLACWRVACAATASHGNLGSGVPVQPWGGAFSALARGAEMVD